MNRDALPVAADPENGLSEAQCRQFEADGFLVVPGLADAALVGALREVVADHLERAVAPFELEAELHYPGAPASTHAPGGRTIRRLLQACDRHPLLREWATSLQLERCLRQLLGEPAILSQAHHNCIMTKQPSYSSQTNWHQDIRYWAFAKPDLVSVWLALGEETEENGALGFIPGSHRLSYADSQFDNARFFRPDLPQNQELIARRVTPHLNPGDVVFFHCLTFHAASDNRTERTKLSAVFTYHGQSNHAQPGTRSARYPEIVL